MLQVKLVACIHVAGGIVVSVVAFLAVELPCKVRAAKPQRFSQTTKLHLFPIYTWLRRQKTAALAC